MATPVKYGIGQNTTDHKTGSPSITIVSGVATLTVAQTSTSLIVGDRITYPGGDGYSYIASFISQTQFNMINQIGATSTNVGPLAVSSIAHEYSSASAAEAGASDINHLNTLDLVTGDYELNFPCCYDSGADTTAVTIAGYTTATANFIRFYTPTNTTTECNQRQRHSGVWSSTKWNLTGSGAWLFLVNCDHVRLEGLQVFINSTSYGTSARTANGGVAGDIQYEDCILKGTGAGSTSGISYVSAITGTKLKVWNCVFYDLSSRAVRTSVATLTTYCYNVTSVDCPIAFKRESGTFVTKNCIAQGATDGWDGTFTSSDYNLSNIVSDAPSASYRSGLATTVMFENSGVDNFALSPADLYAKDSGTNLSADANIPFSDDIVETSRPQGPKWDIGAFELILKRIFITTSA